MTQATFAKRVLTWFDKHGRKDLPWQIRTTPYRVWVSEIMLQQTQVQTVIPYYQRFMKLFPNVKQLALADDNAVLAAWSGLGYYARARNLHASAKRVWHDYHGRFPRDRDALEALPGIGRSTAAAICAISYDQAEAILDGNVKRLLSRYFAVSHPVESREGLALLWQHAESLLPRSRFADYTQAMMDLGAMVCVRGQADCQACPLKSTCQAYQHDCVATYPKRRTKKKRLPNKSTQMMVVVDNAGRYLLERRPKQGIWGGLWCFPTIDDANESVEQFTEQRGWHCRSHQGLPAFRHTFTHFHLTISPQRINLTRRYRAGDNQCWFQPTDTLPGGIPKPVRQLLDQLTEDN